MIYLSALPKEEQFELSDLQDPHCSRNSPLLASLIAANQPNDQLCSVCSHVILDRYVLFVDHRPFHAHCLRCSLCECDLSIDSTCYFKDGFLLCKRDYYRKYRTTCAKCSHPIVESDLVMRARDVPFHMTCFSCSLCGCHLQTGEIFTMNPAGDLFCRLHCDTPIISQALPTQPPPPIDDPIRKEELNIDLEKQPHSQQQLLSQIHQQGFDNDDNPQNPRSKRMRTSFKHHQLRTMKTYFNLNHNPDSKDLKQLAIKTGLSKRVLQVWFQNARAKYRRSMNLRDNQNVSPGDIFSGLDGSQPVGSMSSGSLSVSPHSPYANMQGVGDFTQTHLVQQTHQQLVSNTVATSTESVVPPISL
ncbi:unnamed protein product, partial [Mesorhabditis belari]|uniref:Uncharacterized protein n=1 Tax=Mesorhabditis belari TaxID=2138241 RepID=A0AAF3EX30_9BILA